MRWLWGPARPARFQLRPNPSLYVSQTQERRRLSKLRQLAWSECSYQPESGGGIPPHFWWSHQFDLVKGGAATPALQIGWTRSDTPPQLLHHDIVKKLAGSSSLNATQHTTSHFRIEIRRTSLFLWLNLLVLLHALSSQTDNITLIRSHFDLRKKLVRKLIDIVPVG